LIDTAFTKEHQPVSDLAVVQRAAMVPIKDRRLAFGGPYEDILSAIFLHRGIESLDELATGAKDLLHFNQLNGIQAAVELLFTGLQSQQKIVIIGDFDADGATSTALCMLALRDLGFNSVQYLVPNRFDFGYGLSPEIVDVAIEQYAPDILLTVDNGIACHAGVAHAKAHGLKVIITDHHLPGESLPNADAIVNPNQHYCEFGSKHLAGVGVAFYVLSAFKTHLLSVGWFPDPARAPNLAQYLDIVALGTVADVVKLDKNNRIFVYQGVQRIRAGRCRPGIRALLDVASKAPDKVTATDLGFILGPRLNAAGRLEDMAQGIECLLADDYDTARGMAHTLDSLNRQRREIEGQMREQAEAALASIQLDDATLPDGLVLYDADFHQGVIGILAGRIKEQHYRPTVVFAQQDDHELKGSARSIPGVHIRDVFDEINTRHPHIIKKFGGHAMAAGLSINVQYIDEFTTAFHSVLAKYMAQVPNEAQILSDGQLSSRNMTLDFAHTLVQAGPWGQGFEEPIFDNIFELVSQRVVGQKHLKMVLKLDQVTVDAIAFNIDVNTWPDLNVKRVHVAYKLNINEFRGQQSVQCMVVKFGPAYG
jgi:single-stranded-DNA-specific exonuclease